MRLSSIVLGCLAAACAPAPAPSSPSGPPASAALTLEAERRAILAELIAVDTSHGHETDALRPIARRFADAGVRAEIFEPAPGRGTLVARLPGTGAKRPLLVMAHVDVVPVERQPWTVPPFRATEKDGFLYGRGVSDDKGMASAIVAIVLELARTRAALARDLIVALTAGEENDKVGIRWLVEHRALIDAELAIDEGGAIVTADDQSRVVAVEISAAEKITQSYRLAVKGPGGHSSLPPTDTDPTAILGRALQRVAAHRFAPRALPMVKDQLASRATREPAPVRGALERVVASAPVVAPGDEAILAGDRYLNALIHTTCVTTMLQASPQANVLPTTAEAVVNCRILPDETPAQVEAALVRIIDDPAVAVTLEPRFGGVAPLTEIDASIMDAVRGAAARWSGAAVYPTMLIGSSDSRFLRAAGIPSYGLYASPTSFAEDNAGRTAHGPDERVPVKWLDDGVRFLRDVVLHLAGPDDAPRRAIEIGDRVRADQFEVYPEYPTSLRPPGATFDGLHDDSIAAVAARAARLASWRDELRAIDPAAIAADARARLSYQVAREVVEAAVGQRVCRDELWTVSPAGNGWPARFTTLVGLQPVGSEALRAQALARFAKMAGYIDAQIANLRQGLREGYLAHDGSVRAVIGQIDRLLATPVDRSPFLGPADRDGTPELRARLIQVLAASVLPAVQRYRDFLAAEYLPRARSTPGVSRNPQGAACYRAMLRTYTTLDLDPAEAHRTGWRALAAIEADMKALADRSFGGTDVKALLARFRTDPQYRYQDRDQVMALAGAAVARARAALPLAFGLLPTDDVTVEPIPDFLAKTSNAHYELASLDGSRPATYRVRLYQPEQQSRVIDEGTAFHEAIPGHHLQIGIALRRPDVPAVARELVNSGYGEGWALYAEGVADELGLYSSDADRMGMLSNRAWRAVRVIVDTGIHALGWDRQKAIDALLAHTALSHDQAQSQVDRYIAWPGQATAYLIGYLEITRLRAEAQQALGPRFDLRAFHDRVLEDGAMPLPALRAKLTAWIRAAVADRRR